MSLSTLKKACCSSKIIGSKWFIHAWTFLGRCPFFIFVVTYSIKNMKHFVLNIKKTSQWEIFVWAWRCNAIRIFWLRTRNLELCTSWRLTLAQSSPLCFETRDGEGSRWVVLILQLLPDKQAVSVETLPLHPFVSPCPAIQASSRWIKSPGPGAIS